MSSEKVHQIGTVEVLKTRIYPLDPETADHPLATTVVVEPGTYPLYGYWDAVFWVMTGKVNSRGFDKIGDGLFTMNSLDAPEGPAVTFPSRRYGPEQWAEFIAEPVCVEGHPEQRLRVLVDESAPA